MANHEYIESANCASTDAEAFFPSRGESNKAAKDVCSRCIVIDDCLEDALIDKTLLGIRGGTSERERSKLRKVKE